MKLLVSSCKQVEGKLILSYATVADNGVMGTRMREPALLVIDRWEDNFVRWTTQTALYFPDPDNGFTS